MANTNTGVGPRKLTMKRSDGKPDTDIISDANGKWSIDVGSEGKGKVTFQFFSGEEKLGEQEINFINRMDLLDGFDNLSTKKDSNVKGLLLDDELRPLRDAIIDFTYSVDDATPVEGKAYPSSNDGFFTCSIPTSEMVGKKRVTVTLNYDNTTATRTYNLVDEYLPMNFSPLHMPMEIKEGEPLVVYGKSFYDYNALPLLGPSRKLYYFEKHPAMMTDATELMEDNGYFKLVIPDAQGVALINNGGMAIQGAMVVKDLKPAELFRVAPRSLMIFNSSFVGSSSEWWGRVFDEDGNTPKLNQNGVVCADLRMSRMYQSGSINSDGSVETWLSTDEDSKNPHCFVDGRLVLPNMTRYHHNGDMFNLAAGTSNWVRIGEPAVNVLAYTDKDSIPKPGVGVKLSFIENNNRVEIGTATTDKYGVVKFDIPKQDKQTRLEMVAEAGEFELFFVNDWVDPAKYQVATDISLPFIPPIFYDGYIQLNFDPINEKGERFNLNPEITYEGMHMQIRDYPFFRPYLDLGDDQGRYMFSLNGVLDKFPNRTRIAASCDEMRVEKDVVIGKAKGINPLIYAAGAGVAGYPITVGWRILDDTLTPMSEKTVKVWLDKVEGEPAHTLTTDKYGSVLVDIPWKPLNYTRTIVIQSEGDEFTQELMWTKKATACDINFRFSDTQMTGAKWFFDIEAKDQFGKVLYDDDCVLYEVWQDKKAGIYEKQSHALSSRLQNRSGQFSYNWPSDDTVKIDYVYFTETGFKEFTFDKDKLSSPASDTVGELKVLPWSPVRATTEVPTTLVLSAKNASGEPVSNATIQVHQTDANGKSYGSCLTNEQGMAFFNTTHSATAGNEVLYFNVDNVSTTHTIEWSSDEGIGARFKDVDWTLDVANDHDGVIVGQVEDYKQGKVSNPNLRFYDVETEEVLSGIGTRTFMDGRFTVTVPASEGVKDLVVATDSGFYPFRMIWSDIPLVNPTNFKLHDSVSRVFVMDQDMLVSGTMLDENGKGVRLTGVPELLTKASNENYTNNPLITPDGEFEVFQYPEAVGELSIDWKLGDTVVDTMTFPIIEEAYLEITPMSVTAPYYQSPASLSALVTDGDGVPVEGAYVALTGDSVTGKVGRLTDHNGLVKMETPYPEADGGSLDFTMAYCGGIQETMTVTWVPRSSVPAKEFFGLNDKEKCSEGENFNGKVRIGYNRRPATVDSTLQLYDFTTKQYTDITENIENKNSATYTIPAHDTGVYRFAMCGSGCYQEFEIEWIVGKYDPVDGIRINGSGLNAEVGGVATITGYLLKDDIGYLATKEEPLYARRKSDGKVFEGKSTEGGNFAVDVIVDQAGEVNFELYRREELILGETWYNGISVGSITVGPDASKLLPLGEYPYLPVYVRDSDGNGIEDASVNVYIKGGDGTSLTDDTTDEYGYIDLWPEGREDAGDLTYVLKFGSKEVEHTVTFTDDVKIPYSISSFTPRKHKTGTPIRVGGYLQDHDGEIITNVNLGAVWLSKGDAIDLTDSVDDKGRFEVEIPASDNPDGYDTLSIYTTSTYNSNSVSFDDQYPNPYRIEWVGEFPEVFGRGRTRTVSGKVVDKEGNVVDINGSLYASLSNGQRVSMSVADGEFDLEITPMSTGEFVLSMFTRDEGYLGREIITVV